MNAITLLKDDHRTIKQLFRRYRNLGDRAYLQRRRLVAEMREELSRHASIEETVFYPAIRAALPDATDDVLESLEEHHIVKWTLDELEKMDPREERYNAKVTVLMENVKHHIGEEESELFPEVRRGMGRRELDALGVQLKAAKGIAPTRPHPRAPDEPPGNIVATLVAAPLDAAIGRAKQTARRVTRRG
ncbi:MAG: hemerythrin domain-containing protein [Candidatus Dormibacteraeota bacterium]|nr:hemerythrin domain-containing protein [Candidatus Dormibacteraeota bacterium]MBV8444980.1 hemerythrin domain-containing protein [Candidatus Dormibacteraeota bacterium]